MSAQRFQSLLTMICTLFVLLLSGAIHASSPKKIGKIRQWKDARFARKSDNAIVASVPVVTVFIHGVMANANEGKSYAKHHYFIEGPCYFIAMPDEVKWFPFGWATWLRDVRKGCLAQDDEIRFLYDHVSTILKEHPDHQMVLYGVSRGASLIVNFIAFLQEEDPALLERIGGAVVESPFAHMYDVLEHKRTITFLPSLKIKHKIFHTIMFPRHDIEGIQPINSVSKIPHTVPFFFAGTVNDIVIPIFSTQRLFDALYDQRLQCVCPDELCVMTQFCSIHGGRHASMLCEQYRQQLIAFYRGIGLAK